MTADKGQEQGQDQDLPGLDPRDRSVIDTEAEQDARILPVTDAAGKAMLSGDQMDWIEFEYKLKLALINAQCEAAQRQVGRLEWIREAALKRAEAQRTRILERATNNITLRDLPFPSGSTGSSSC